MNMFMGALKAAFLPCALALITSHAAAAASATKANGQTGNWEIVQGEFAGRQTCMAIGSADRSTVLTLKLDTGHMADHVIAVLFMNMDWSIKEGDELGELRFHAGDQIAGADPVAADRGFFYYMSLDPAEVWFNKTKASGFWIERDGQEIARYKGGNLAETFRKIRACGERLIKADPFAARAAPAPAPRSTVDPSITEPVVTRPKPVNLASWIGAIQRDYLAGPAGGSDLDLRRDRRNSSPASVQFRMVVDEHGTMAACQIVASSGLSDWRDEFCSLAARHPLAFTPSRSASGKPVRGEYITNAIVAME